MSSLQEKWSDKYKKSIDCNNPKGFSQRAHCQGRKKKMSEEKKDHEYSMARSELKTVASAVKRLQKKIEDITLEKTQISRKKLTEILTRKTDWYMSAEEALNLGVIDEIV